MPTLPPLDPAVEACALVLDARRRLEADPTAYRVRFELADAVDPINPGLGEGYYVLAALQLHPRSLNNESSIWWNNAQYSFPFPPARAKPEDLCGRSMLPGDWFEKLPPALPDGTPVPYEQHYWPFAHDSAMRGRRWYADWAAAYAFTRLPPNRRKELLALADAAV